MKKIFLLILSLCFLLGVIGCNPPEEGNSDSYEIVLSDGNVGLALGDKTVSGADNSLMTGYTTSLSKVFENGETENLTPEWTSSDSGVVSVSDGVLVPQGEGQTVVKATYDNEVYECDVTVGTAIASKEDFTTLALASYKPETHALLSETYVMVCDVDYEDSIFYPIAGVSLDGNMTPYNYNGPYRFYTDSLQWKALLEQRFNDFDWSEFSRQGINPQDIPFSGIINGNGYLVKNASLMADNVITNAWDRLGGAFNNVIGRLTGELKNICFENLSYQEFKNGSCGVDIVDMYSEFDFANGLKFGNPTYKPGATPINVAYMQTCSGLVYENKGLIENVYLNVWRPELVSLGNAYGCIGGISVLNYGKIKNVVCEHMITPGRLPSIICGSLVENGSMENCFAIIGTIEDGNRTLVYGLEDNDAKLSTSKIFYSKNAFCESDESKKLDKATWNIEARDFALRSKS
ncbi:MAG: hypothetical protein IKC83_00220 [Clostridia bacterium]|nr:hypothetical protein [Clostridia bacterium]